MTHVRLGVVFVLVMLALLGGQALFPRKIAIPPSQIVEPPVTAGESAVVSSAAAEVPAISRGDATGINEEQYRVLAVVDGDTIDVEIAGVPTRVRYIGINTPETVHPTRAAECFGREASTKNAALVSGKMVTLERDVNETDRYGRLLRYVYVDGVMINETLVAQGYASVSTYPPDVRYTERFQTAEATAREAEMGLWGAGCNVYRSPSSEEGSAGVNNAAGTCSIKGNISETGERIYHTLGCEYYHQTVITETKGERWFCTDDEALAAGWRKALNCP
jgi:micrococcal nuclease